SPSLTHSLTYLLILSRKCTHRAASRAHWEVDNMKKVTHTDKQTRNKTHTKNNQKAGNPGRARRKSSRQVRRTKQAGEQVRRMKQADKIRTRQAGKKEESGW
ncbi:MAG: hypothetical protein ACK559_41575, partial [bacterium]